MSWLIKVDAHSAIRAPFDLRINPVHRVSVSVARPTLNARGTREIYEADEISNGGGGSMGGTNASHKAYQSHRWATLFSDEVVHIDEVRSLARVSEADAQAMLLSRLDEPKAAKAIGACGTMRYPCGHRFCPSCSLHWHRVHRARLSVAFAEMKRPKVFLLKVFSKTLSATSLKTALKTLTRGWRTLKRRAFMSSVKMFAGIVEVSPVTLGGHPVWSVHVHGIADVNKLDLSAAQKEWVAITKSRNSTLGVQPLRSREGYLRYISKMRDRCPPPGWLRPAWLLKVLVRAMRNEHAWIEWGLLTSRGRRRRADAKRG